MYYKGNVMNNDRKDGYIYGSFMDSEEGLQKDDRAEIKVVTVDQTFSSKPHYYNTATKIDFMLQGTAIWIVDGREVYMQTGDFIIIPPKTTAFVKKIISPKAIIQTIKIPSLQNDRVEV